MSEPVDVTVLMAVHNQAEALPNALAHLELQHFPAARFEVVVVDAASTDGSADITERYAAGAPVATRCIRRDSPNLVVALNGGVRESQGRLVLFLDPELLAGPAMIERHVHIHERYESPVCAVGMVMPHPQLGSGPWRTLEVRHVHTADAPLPYLEWQGQNMSLPRTLFLEHGGFDEEFAFPYYADAELAWRLTRAGVPGYLQPEAVAYFWQAGSLPEECGRQYAQGYCLHTLGKKTGFDEVQHRYPPSLGAFRSRLARLSGAASMALCQVLEQETQLFKELYRHVLRREYVRGFCDAENGRLPRPMTSGAEH